jgi:hypothetical protein
MNEIKQDEVILGVDTHLGLGVRPVATKSIICWRNCTEYGALGLWFLGILDSLFCNDKVSVKSGQLQTEVEIERPIMHCGRLLW